MITNAREHRQAKGNLKAFEQALHTARETEEGLERERYNLLQSGVEAQLEQLREEIREYEALRDGTKGTIEAGFGDLGLLLILARNLRKMSQQELAEKLRIKQQQVQRYEANEYEQANYARLKEVAWGLGLTIDLNVRLGVEASRATAVVVASRPVGYEAIRATPTKGSGFNQIHDAHGQPQVSLSAATYGPAGSWTTSSVDNTDMRSTSTAANLQTAGPV